MCATFGSVKINSGLKNKCRVRARVGKFQDKITKLKTSDTTRKKSCCV
jgi:hypothetical protein